MTRKSHLGRIQKRALRAIADDKPCHVLSAREIGRAWDRLAELGLLRPGSNGWELTDLGRTALTEIGQ